MVYHVKQLGGASCGAASAAMVFGIPYAEAMRRCKTDKTGTFCPDVLNAAKELQPESFHLRLEANIKDLWWLHNLSCKYPLYLGLTIKSVGGRGRPSVDHHAVALIGGKIYDPDKNDVFTLDTYAPNYKVTVDSVIVFTRELSTYGKNKLS